MREEPSGDLVLLTREYANYRSRYLFFTLSNGLMERYIHPGAETLKNCRLAADLIFGSEDRLPFSFSLDRPGMILLLVSQKEQPRTQPLSDDWSDYADEAMQTLGLGRSAVAPSVVEGSLITPWGPPGESHAAILLSREKELWYTIRDGTHLCLQFPEVVLDLAELRTGMRVLEHLATRLEKTPLYSLDPLAYVDRLSSEGESQIRIYLSEYLSERKTTLAELHQVTRTEQSVEAALKYNKILKPFRDGYHAPSPWVTEHRVYYQVTTAFYSRLELVRSSLQDAKQELEGRRALVGEFLRDRLTAEVAASNLQVQKALRLLALLAVALAVLTALVSTMPERFKQALWEWFWNYTQ